MHTCKSVFPNRRGTTGRVTRRRADFRTRGNLLRPHSDPSLLRRTPVKCRRANALAGRRLLSRGTPALYANILINPTNNNKPSEIYTEFGLQAYTLEQRTGLRTSRSPGRSADVLIGGLYLT